MKILRLTTDGELSEHEYPYVSVGNTLRSLIGSTCEYFEHVRPKRLYRELGYSGEPSRFPGKAISMLIDEEGLLKYLPENPFASWLYEADKHGNPIVGDVLFVGELLTEDGDVDFCGIEETIFNKLKRQIKEYLKIIKK